MTKAELESKLLDLENRLSALGDIPAKITEIESYAERAKTAAGSVDESSQKVGELRQTVEDTAAIAQTIGDNNNKYSEEFNKLKDGLGEAEKRARELATSIEQQLGDVSAAVLSHQFSNVADNLKKSVYMWLGMVIISSLVLLVAAVAIVGIEVYQGNNFWSANFLIKLTLTTPIIYFLLFATRQYSKEKRLYDEYTFKSAVALSFEAHRKIISPDNQEPENKAKVLDFLITSIQGIYLPPGRGEEDKAELDISTFEQSMELAKKIIPFNLFSKK